MPKFYKTNLLSKSPDNTPKLLTPEHLLESPLDTPELSTGTPSPAPISKVESNASPPQDENDDPVRTLLIWVAPSRPHRKKDRSFYTTVGILILLVSLIALLAGEKILIGALLALAFLVYVINFVPPQDAHYRLSTQGITIDDHFYHWQELDSFWFSEKDGYKILHVLTLLTFPGVLMLVLGDVSEDDIKKVCGKYLPFHEIAPRTQLEKWAESLQKHFPLENPNR